MLESYDQQCDEAAKIFSEYHKRLRYYVNQARDAQRSSAESVDLATSIHTNSDKDSVYSTVRGSKSTDDVILIETARERNIRKACESIVEQMIEKIRSSFPAYEGCGIHVNSQSEAAKLGFEFDGEIPEEVRDVIVSCSKSPPQLLLAITSYTERLQSMITKEIEKIDVRADAETLRYVYLYLLYFWCNHGVGLLGHIVYETLDYEYQPFTKIIFTSSMSVALAR